MLADDPLRVVDYLWLPGQPLLSWLIWLLVALAVLYVARLPAHKVITIFFSGNNRLLRLLARFLIGINARLRQRNRDVLLARGRDACQYKIEKNFVRIAAQVADDLSAWPSLHREMREQLTHMDSEMASASEQPPQPPEWLQVIEAVAQIPAHGSTVIAKILTDIHATLKQAMESSLVEYRQANRSRYALLNRMTPQWRSMETRLDDLDNKITRLGERTQVIDAQMQAYEQILQGADQAVRVLTRSAASSLLLSTFLLLIACAGGIVNFQLLALPLSEVVGVHGDIFGVRSSSVATAVVVFLQIILGLFLLEAAGVTRLLPDIAMLEPRKRRGVMYLMMLVLLIMAGMESLLIYTRDGLLADNDSLNQLLAVPATTNTISMEWIPALGQVVIGFILPLLLIFSVIAFETFIYAFRAVVGMFLSWLLDVLAMLVRLLATLMQLTARVLIALYDLLIALPLYFERVLQHRASPMPAGKKVASTEPDQ
jgi:hypothetical protein